MFDINKEWIRVTGIFLVNTTIHILRKLLLEVPELCNKDSSSGRLYGFETNITEKIASDCVTRGGLLISNIEHGLELKSFLMQQ